MTPLDTTAITYNKLGPILHSVQTNELQFDNITNQLDNNYRTVIDSVNTFEQTIEQLKSKLDQTISQMEPSYYAESFRLYSQEMIHDSPEYILTRRPTLTAEAYNFINARIQTHVNWQHAGMIIHPGHEDWIEKLVGLDPLYLVAQHAGLLEPAILRFNDQYQRRLRPYVVTETTDFPILDQLPTEQFAFCLVYNFFNYKPVELIKIYLKEILTKLKSGGTLAMTINDCDRADGVKLAESSFMCYTPGQMLIEYAKDIGFEVCQLFRANDAYTWIELQRPGKLKSYRGGQTLARLVYKPVDILYTNK